MNSRFSAILVVLVVGFVGVFIITKGGSDSGTSNVPPTNHVYGEGQKGVTLIEYGDFQCPGCEAFAPVLREVKEKYKAEITFQFRNFPLTQLHQNAMAAHRAAEAAHNQGKFWEMHDLLYQSQNNWESIANPTSFFESIATQLGLDMAKYRQDVSSTATNDLINADIKAGQDIGANSTPTFVLDGKKIDNPDLSVEAFSKLIDGAIKAKNQ